MTAAPSARFPRSARLRKRRQFLRVQSRGVRVHGKHLLTIVAPHSKSSARLGITASKKVGNAIARNRAKRVVRAAFREIREQLPAWIDIVVIARRSLLTQKTPTVQVELEKCLKSALAILRKRRRRPRTSDR